MPERKIEPFTFNGKTIYIEVTEAELDQVQLVASDQGLPDYAEYTSVKDKVIAAGEAVRDTIAALVETVQQGMAGAAPDEWTIEINLGFKGKAGIPFVSEGETNGAIKVSAKWKRQEGA